MIPMLDTIGDNVDNLPKGTRKVAGYVTGSGGIAWDAEDWSQVPNAVKVRIDQSPDGHAALSSDVLDVENGAATPATAVAWVKARIAAGITWSTIYGSADKLGSVHAALEAAGPHGWYFGHVYAWLADWNLNEQQASAMLGQQASGLTIVAVQWASPTSNPNTPVPGDPTGKTLAQANIDISATADAWQPGSAPTPPPPPPPVLVQHGILVTQPTPSSYAAKAVVSRDGGKTWE